MILKSWPPILHNSGICDQILRRSSKAKTIWRANLPIWYKVLWSRDAVGNEFPDDSEFKDLFREAEHLFIQAEVCVFLRMRLVL